MLLAGPGLPHWIEVTEYPLRFVTVYFLPGLLLDLAPAGDGLQMVRRFVGPQAIGRHLLRPPPPLREYLQGRFAEMVEEYERPGFGQEARLRTLLLDMLVRLMRWEQEAGDGIAGEGANAPGGSADGPRVDWQRVQAALAYLRDHYAEPIYASDLADAAGVTDARLKRLFRDALGMSWGKYLQGFRVHQAASRLSTTQCSVLDAALGAGFETRSHFNATFRAFTGFSPREYRRHVTTSAGRASELNRP